ncbi:hypothetical protein ACTXGQ_12495 [Marinobacter sp. 1Y8]
MSSAIESLDALIDDYRHALSMEDWDGLNVITESVQPCVDAAVAEVQAGDVSADLLTERLLALRRVADEVAQGAGVARQTAADGLKEVGRSRNAVNAYADVSHRKPR